MRFEAKGVEETGIGTVFTWIFVQRGWIVSHEPSFSPREVQNILSTTGESRISQVRMSASKHHLASSKSPPSNSKKLPLTPEWCLCVRLYYYPKLKSHIILIADPVGIVSIYEIHPALEALIKTRTAHSHDFLRRPVPPHHQTLSDQTYIPK